MIRSPTSSGEQLGAGLGKLHIGPGFVHPQPAAGDGELDAGAIFGRTATFLKQKRPVDLLNVDPAVLDRLDRVGDLKQLARGFFRVGERSLGGIFHRLASTVMWAS